ncbi:MAG TPA: hypothetical protein VGM27_24635 [Acidobacteriaceae bacterium]|jgi:hypothetical protein
MRLALVVNRVGREGIRQLSDLLHCNEDKTAVRIIGWTSVALCVAALGLYVGHELRERYKFNQRTQYDLFSHAGDSVPAAEYGMGT